MGNLSTIGKNVLLDGLTAVYASLHSGSPGTNGANELTGGSPAYARKELTMGAASGGVRSASNQPTFDIPAGETVAHVGFWDAATAGNFLGSHDVTDEVYGSQGQYTLTNAELSLTDPA